MKAMQSRFTLILLMMSALVISAALVGCTTTSVDDAKKELRPLIDTTKLVNPGTLTVGVDSKTAPFALVDNEGKLQGINVDLATALGDELGVKVQVVAVNEATSAITQKQADIVLGVSTQEQGASSQVALVGRYVDNAPGLFTKSSQGKPVTATQQEVNKASIGVQDNSVSWALVRREFSSAKLKTFSSLNDAFKALSEGQVEYVACDSYAGGFLALDDPSIVYAGTLEVPVSYGVAIAASNDELQTQVQGALDKLVSNGVFDLLRAKWTGGLPALSTDTMVHLNEVGTAIQQGEVSVDENKEGQESADQNGTSGTNGNSVQSGADQGAGQGTSQSGAGGQQGQPNSGQSSQNQTGGGQSNNA